MALVTAPLGHRDTFPYRKLENREIRLVIVKKHVHWPRANGLTCSIEHINIDDSRFRIPYTALSYTWGDGQDVTSLKLLDVATRKSGEITITSSLLLALQTILKPGQDHALWIDQICIDQSSTVEKSQQVQLMRWIYERAKAVHIWLGPASEDSDEAMIYLRDNDRTSLLRDLSDRSQARFTLRLEVALKELFRRPYWDRMWTIQEATALKSQNIVVSCGHCSVDLARIFDWASAGYGAVNNISDFVAELQGTGIDIMNRFRYMRRQSVLPLHVLTVRLRHSTASDPRDKIYAMLNFATDIPEQEIKPDYTKTAKQTYTELVLWSISKYQSLDVLGDCRSTLTGSTGPSWVPDWGQIDGTNSFMKTSDPDDPGSSTLYRASGKYLRDVNVQKPVEVNTRLLLLSGVRVGQLNIVSNRVRSRWDTWTAQKTWQPKDGERICPLNNSPMHEVFRKTIYLDATELSSVEFTRGSLAALPWDRHELSMSPTEAKAMRYPRAMGIGRCPFYTKPCTGSSHGLLGLSHATAKPGDELWILKGGKMPFVLRPIPMTIPSTNLTTGETKALPVNAGMPTYELLGEAFVLGLMDGEIIDMLGETPKRERPPPLADMDRYFRTIALI